MRKSVYQHMTSVSVCYCSVGVCVLCCECYSTHFLFAVDLSEDESGETTSILTCVESYKTSSFFHLR